MAVLFDPADDYVCSVLELAKVRGEISLADLESIVEAGIEAKDSISTDDIGDTIDALANMGIEINDGLTEEQKDAEFLRSMRERASDSRRPHLTLSGDATASLARAIKREKDAENAPRDPRKEAEDAAAVRKILSKRTFIQTCSPTWDLGSGASAEVRERHGQTPDNSPETSASNRSLTGSISRRASLPWTYISARWATVIPSAF